MSPKSIAREMVEEYLGFGEYVRRYGLQRSEGVLLRYLSQAYKTLDQNVPDTFKSDAVWDVVGYLRAVIERTDTSLIEEWESLIHPELRFQGEELAHRPPPAGRRGASVRPTPADVTDPRRAARAGRCTVAT